MRFALLLLLVLLSLLSCRNTQNCTLPNSTSCPTFPLDEAVCDPLATTLLSQPNINYTCAVTIPPNFLVVNLTDAGSYSNLTINTSLVLISGDLTILGFANITCTNPSNSRQSDGVQLLLPQRHWGAVDVWEYHGGAFHPGERPGLCEYECKGIPDGCVLADAHSDGHGEYNDQQDPLHRGVAAEQQHQHPDKPLPVPDLQLQPVPILVVFCQREHPIHCALPNHVQPVPGDQPVDAYHAAPLDGLQQHLYKRLLLGREPDLPGPVQHGRHGQQRMYHGAGSGQRIERGFQPVGGMWELGGQRSGVWRRGQQ